MCILIGPYTIQIWQFSIAVLVDMELLLMQFTVHSAPSVPSEITKFPCSTLAHNPKNHGFLEYYAPYKVPSKIARQKCWLITR